MAGGAAREVEIKLAAPSAAWARRLLRRHGFRAVAPRAFQSDVILDTASGALRRSGSLLRLRHSQSRAWLTYKGPAIPGRHKDREELELGIGSAEAVSLEQVLARLGFRPSFRYEKYRTSFAAVRGGGLIALDETPIGVFLELEGAPAWIDHTARRLGFRESDYITATYADLYREHCRKSKGEARDMVFARS